MSRWRLIHVNVCHHGNEELLRASWDFVKIMLKLFYQKLNWIFKYFNGYVCENQL